MAGRARKLQDRLRQSVADVRSVVHGVRLPILDQLGLTAAALRELGHGYVTSKCTISVEELGELPAAVEVATYAIAVEAVANAVPHSAASRMVISACRRKDKVLLEVLADGCGLPSRPPAGVGLRSMAEGTHEVGGRLYLCSNGTRRHSRSGGPSAAPALTIRVLVVDDHPVFEPEWRPSLRTSTM